MNRRSAVYLCVLLLCALSVGCSDDSVLQPPSPAATPIPGWEKFKGGGVELWLPESYEAQRCPEAPVARVGGGAELWLPESHLGSHPVEHYVAVSAFDPEVGRSGFVSQVRVFTLWVPSQVKMGGFLDGVLGELPAELVVLERGTVPLGETKAGRVVMEYTAQGMVGTQIMIIIYAVRDGNIMWVIRYATGAEEFDQHLPVFEQSALTFARLP